MMINAEDIYEAVQLSKTEPTFRFGWVWFVSLTGFSLIAAIPLAYALYALIGRVVDI